MEVEVLEKLNEYKKKFDILQKIYEFEKLDCVFPKHYTMNDSYEELNCYYKLQMKHIGHKLMLEDLNFIKQNLKKPPNFFVWNLILQCIQRHPKLAEEINNNHDLKVELTRYILNIPDIIKILLIGFKEIKKNDDFINSIRINNNELAELICYIISISDINKIIIKIFKKLKKISNSPNGTIQTGNLVAQFVRYINSIPNAEQIYDNIIKITKT
jgi:hypothetical protein